MAERQVTAGFIEIILASFDHNRPPVYGQRHGLTNIHEYVGVGAGSTRIIVFPKHLEHEKYCKLFVESLGEEPMFVLLGKSLASTLNVSPGLEKPREVMFDACVVYADQPSYLLTVASCEISEEVRLYNTAVARGLVTLVRTYSTERFAPLHGCINIQELTSVDDPPVRKKWLTETLDSVKAERSKLLNPVILQMNEVKMISVAHTIVTAIAIRSPRSDIESGTKPTELLLMTLEQFCLLSESLDQMGEYEVGCDSDEDFKVVANELVNRLGKSSPVTVEDDTGNQITLHDISEMLMQDLSVHIRHGENTCVIHKSHYKCEKSEAILVSDLPENVTEWALSLYFDHASRTKVDESDVDLNKAMGNAIVYFQDTEAVDRVMMKKTHQIESKNVTVTRLLPTGTHSNASSWLASIRDERTLEVHGAGDLDAETISNYFYGFSEFEPKVTCHEHRVFVSFLTEREARAVSEMDDLEPIDGRSIEVKLQSPKPMYMDRFCVYGLNPTTDRNRLESFLHRVISSPLNITYGSHHGTAMVKVEGSFVWSQVKKLCRERPLDGVFLDVSSLPISDCILVRGFEKGKSIKSLQYYLESPKSGNKSKSKSVVKPTADGTVLLVTFSNPEAIEQILAKSSHQNQGLNLDVSLYIEGIDEEDGGGSSMWQDAPLPFTIGPLNPDVIAFIKHSTHQTQLEPQLAECDARCKWDTSSVDIVCTKSNLTEKTSASTWKTKAEDCFTSFYSQFWSFVVDVPTHLDWISVVSDMKRVAGDATLCEDEKKSQVTVSGYGSTKDEIHTNIRQCMANAEPTSTDEIEEHLCVDFLRLRYLQKTDGLEFIKLKYPSVEMSTDLKTLKGPKQQVMNAKKELTSKTKSLSELGVPNMTDFQLRLPADTELCKYVDRKLEEKDMKGVWETNGNILRIVSDSDKSTAEIIAVITNSLCDPIRKLTAEQAGLFKGNLWDDFAEKENLDKQLITVCDNNLKIYTIDIYKDYVLERVTKFLQENTKLTRSQYMSKGEFKFLTKHRRDALTQLKKESSVQIKQMKSSFELKGTESNLTKACSILKCLNGEIKKRQVVIQATGCRKILQDQKGEKYIEGVENSNRYRCCILEYSRADIDYYSGADDSLVKVSGEPVVVSQVDMSGQKKLFVSRGDITELDVDLLVCPSSLSSHHTMGLAKRIFDMGGPQLEEAFKDNVQSGQLQVGCTTVTGPGSLSKCRFISHAFTPDWEDGKNEEYDRLTEVVEACLDDACNKHLTSVALPALSTGTYGFPPRQATKIIISTIRDYFGGRKKHSCSDVGYLKEIYLCDNNYQKVNSFLESVEEAFPTKDIHNRNRQKSLSPDFPDTETEEERQDPNRIPLHIFSDDEAKIDMAIEAIENYCQRKNTIEPIRDDIIKSLSKDQLGKIKDAGVSYDVTVDIQPRLGNIRVQGMDTDVKEAVSKIQKLIQAERVIRENLTPRYQWKYYQVGHDGSQVLQKYDEDNNEALETRLRNGEPAYDVMLGDENVHHDLELMLRSPLGDPSDQSRLFRVETFHGPACFDVPDRWANLSCRDSVVVKVENPDELEDIQLEISKVTQDPVHEISRIQNDDLWKYFCSKQHHLSEQNGRHEKIKQLWHITSSDKIKQLYTIGAGHDELYGSGVEFQYQPEAAAADDDEDDDDDAIVVADGGAAEDEEDRIYVFCHVLPGRPIQATGNTQFPPMDAKRRTRYDSLAIRDEDDVDQPITSYRIFNSNQVYPEYIVKLRKS